MMLLRSLFYLALSTVIKSWYGTAMIAFPFSIGLAALIPTTPLGGLPKYDGYRTRGSVMTPFSLSQFLYLTYKGELSSFSVS